MDIDHYDNIERSADYKLYSFMSSGPKGDLENVIKFTVFPDVDDSAERQSALYSLLGDSLLSSVPSIEAEGRM